MSVCLSLFLQLSVYLSQTFLPDLSVFNSKPVSQSGLSLPIKPVRPAVYLPVCLTVLLSWSRFSDLPQTSSVPLILNLLWIPFCVSLILNQE